MASSETNLQGRIMLGLSQAGCLIWRNETAGAWVGRRLFGAKKGHVILAGARFLKLGLCKGSSDLIGIKPTVITQEMVGQTIGVFIAPEIKTKKGKTTKEQELFFQAVNKAGGIAGVARSVDQAIDLIGG